VTIVPVIDLMGGVVVRGVAGNRAAYRPVESVLTSSCHPLDVARAFRDSLGLTTCYVADLDAIAGAAPDLGLYELLHRLGLELWVDAGVCTADLALRLANAGVDRVVVGLETAHGPDVLASAITALGANRVVFSLDLMDGVPMGHVAAWGATDPLEIVGTARTAGATTVIVLDLRSVGVGKGPTTLPLVRRIIQASPGLAVYCGGGIRDQPDLDAARIAGVAGVLVASALHSGTWTLKHAHGRNSHFSTIATPPGPHDSQETSA
jgi:phosphoribosylformimino-5-aminoimidazole carboxamide ribotide isomerase